MSFNISGLDEDLYFAVNTAVNVAVSFIVVLPPMILCLLCVLALVFATDINLKIRVLLINVFVIEIISWLSYLMRYLLFPVQARILTDNTFLCSIIFSILIISGRQKFFAATFYAVKVYIFIKYGELKLEWYVILPSIIISWIIAMLFSISPYFSSFGVFNSNGFCNVSPTGSAVIINAPTLILQAVVCLSIIIICCILTFVYIKRNILEDNVTVKKAVAKVLFYLTITSILAFINSVTPALVPTIRAALLDESVAGLIAIIYILRIIFNIPSIAIPIISIIVLKPVRTAMKLILLKLCPACRHESVDVTSSTGVGLLATVHCI